MGRAELQPTSDEFVDDILQPLPLDRFEEYRFACMKHAPQSLRGHHYLVVQERWLRYLGAHAAAAEQLSDRCKHRIYAHRAGVASNCTFFGISDVAKDDDVCSQFTNKSNINKKNRIPAMICIFPGLHHICVHTAREPK